MSGSSKRSVKDVCAAFGNDPTRLLDVVLDVQEDAGYVSSEAMTHIANTLEIPRVEEESVVSFYSFLYSEPNGQVVIRLCDDVVDRIKGADRIAASLEEELGIRFGETTPTAGSGSSTPPASACPTRPRRRWSTTCR